MRRPTRTTDLGKLKYGTKKAQLSPRFSQAEDERVQQLLHHLNISFSQLIELVVLRLIEEVKVERQLQACVQSCRLFVNVLPSPTVVQRNVRISPVILDLFIAALRPNMPDIKETTAVRWVIGHYAEALLSRPAATDLMPAGMNLKETARATLELPQGSFVDAVPLTGYYDPLRSKS